MAAEHRKLAELERVLRKYPLSECKNHALKLLRISWKDLENILVQSRLQINPSSVAKGICSIISSEGLEQDIDYVIEVLTLRSLAWHSKKQWQTIKLLDCLYDEEPSYSVKQLCEEVGKSVETDIITFQRKKLIAKVRAVRVDNFIYMSVLIVSEDLSAKKQTLYIALPNYPGIRAVFVSSLNNVKMIHAVIKGLGYQDYKSAKLSGQHLVSMVRILTQNKNVMMSRIRSLPKYDPKPVISKDGIDFMHTAYNENFVNNLLGEDPPILNYLELTTNEPFYNEEILDRRVNVTMAIKSSNVAQTLKVMAKRKAISPNSEWFTLLQGYTKNRNFSHLSPNFDPFRNTSEHTM